MKEYSNLYIIIIFFIFFTKNNINCNTTNCFEYSCEECETEEYGTCTKCRNSFRLVNGTCPCYDNKCALCLIGLAGLELCYICKNGYYNSNEDCYCEIENCDICESPDFCLKCKTGYYFDNTTTTCKKLNDEDKIQCYDPNCDACFSNLPGACDYCKDGFDNVKGKCEQLPSPVNGICNNDYYLDKNNYCEKKCYGIDCPDKKLDYYICPSNKCLLCKNDELKIVSGCNNSDVCILEGCLNCVTNEECIICTQGYYLLNGKCEKCINGCSFCSDSETCIYCLSGYELDEQKKCQLTRNFDFNVEYYKKIRDFLLAKVTYKDIREAVKKYDCDSNCLNCYNSNGKCIKCRDNYKLENNTCIFYCPDPNCLECSEFSGKCYKCKDNYELKYGECLLKCSDPNCYFCNFQDNIETCTECYPNYKLSNNICQRKTNYIGIIFCVVMLLVFVFSIIGCCIYRCKNRRELRRDMNVVYVRNNNTNLPQIYDRDGTGRKILNKEDLMDEYEIQRRKKEKGNELCQFCQKKAGKYKCDCGCIVCKDHSKLKSMEKEGKQVKACFKCEKVVNKVEPIEYSCHICMEKNNNLAHFKCGCALEVCQNCYAKCKLNSNKCPGCRAII